MWGIGGNLGRRNRAKISIQKALARLPFTRAPLSDVRPEAPIDTHVDPLEKLRVELRKISNGPALEDALELEASEDDVFTHAPKSTPWQYRLKQAQLKAFAIGDRVSGAIPSNVPRKHALAAAMAVVVATVSVVSVQASLQDTTRARIIDDPTFYFGVEGGYGRFLLKNNGFNLISPNAPTTGIFGTQSMSGSILFGASNLVNFAKGVNLRGEIELQKIGQPHFIAGNCCVTNSLSALTRGIETTSGFSNLWIDFDVPGFNRTKVFLGGGIGFANHDLGLGLTTRGSNIRFAYHLGGGISHALNPMVDFIIAGRFRDLGRTSLGINSQTQARRSLKHTGLEARIGFRYKLEGLVKH